MHDQTPKTGALNLPHLTNSYTLHGKFRIRKTIGRCTTTMIRHLLEEFLQIEGVTTAALVGTDGFLIESAGSTPEDEEALAALGSGVMAFFSKTGHILDLGKARQFVLEHDDGSIIFTQVSEDTLLTIIAGTRSSAGHLAYILPKITPRVAAVI